MPNPTSKLNLVINGASTQLDIHDANAVDLTNNQTVAGNKEFTGTTTAHDLIPSATDTYNFGSSSYQWNNAYIKSLAINGVAAGDILTHNASEFVDVTTAQTVTGVKTWMAQQKYSGNNTRGVLSIYNPAYTKGSAISATTDLSIGTIFLGDGGATGLANSLGFISCDLSDAGNRSMLSFSAIKNEASSGERANLIVEYDKSDTTSPERIRCKGNVLPNFTDTYNLGIPTRKWKSFNGINPGALSLPTTSLIDITSSITSLDGTTINKFTPQVNGWLLINGTGTANDGFIYATQGRIGAKSANGTTSLRCAVLIPVVAGVEVSVTCKLSTLTWANIVPCQGNV